MADAPRSRPDTKAALLAYMGSKIGEDGKIVSDGITPEEARLSERDVARHIEDARSFIIDPTAKPKSPLVSAATIARFLRETHGGGKRRQTSFETIYKFLVHVGRLKDPALAARQDITDRLSSALNRFFAVTPKGIQRSKEDVQGVYVLYANSEDRKDAARPYIVRGAIRFYYDDANDALAVEERQESRPIREYHAQDEIKLVEIFRGYFFMTGNHVVAVLRSEIDQTPKFYILGSDAYVERERHFTAMHGVMFKVGKDQLVFSSTVYMARDTPKAFDNCDVVAAEEIGKKEDRIADIIHSFSPRDKPQPEGDPLRDGLLLALLSSVMPKRGDA